MTIHFGPLESTTVVGNAAGALTLSGTAQGATALRTLGVAAGVLALAGLASGPAISNTTAVAQGGFVLGGHGWSQPHAAEQGASHGAVFFAGHAEGYLGYGDVAPQIPPTATGVFALTGEASGYIRQFGEGGDSGFAFGGLAYGAAGGADVNGFADGEIVFAGYAEEDAPPTAYGFVVDNFPVVAGFGGLEFNPVYDGLRTGAGAGDLPYAVTRERTAWFESRSGRIEATLALAEALALDARAAVVLHELVAELAVIASPAEYDHTAIARAVERLLARGDVGGYHEAMAVVLDAMVLRELADLYAFEQVTDTAVLSTQVADAYTAMGAVLDRLLTAPEASGAQHLTALVSEALVVDGAVTGAAELAAIVRDAVGLAAHLTLDTGEYVAWVLNTEGRGTSTYANFPFNSFARIGGKYYGATSQGLYLLEGDDDDGEPIAARIRLGLHDMNTRKLKRLPEAYIGYKSDGNLILRVIVADDHTGERIALQYLMRPRAAPNIRESRFEPGRGVKAVDWDFEIENIDGADFDLAAVEFRPLIMDRRTRG